MYYVFRSAGLESFTILLTTRISTGIEKYRLEKQMKINWAKNDVLWLLTMKIIIVCWFLHAPFAVFFYAKKPVDIHLIIVSERRLLQYF